MYKKKRVPTVTLERYVLHYLVTNKTILQGRLSGCTEEWFTNEARSVIFHIIRKAFTTSRKPLTDTQFEYFLNEEYPGEKNDTARADYLAEFQMIRELVPQDECDVVISRLNDALLALETEELIMGAYASLESGDTEEALSKLKQGALSLHRKEEKDRVVSLWEDTEDWLQEVHNRQDYPEQYAGIPTGLKEFDDRTGGLFPAELTVIFGLSGKGKSTLMKAIGASVRQRGYNVLHCGNEENEFQMRTKYISVETGVKYWKWKRGMFDQFDLQAFTAYRDSVLHQEKAGQIYVYSFPQQTDATMIARRLVEMTSQGKRIDLLIVDYLDLMSSIKKAYNENDEGGRITGDLKQLAIDFNIPVLVCTQANTTAERQELRDHPFLTASDVFGTKRKVHSANTLLGIVNQTATVGAGERDPADAKRHRIVLCVPKNRDGAVFTFRKVIEVETGRVVDDDESDPAGAQQQAEAERVLSEAAHMEEESSTREGQRAIAGRLNSRLDSVMQSLRAQPEEPAVRDVTGVPSSPSEHDEMETPPPASETPPPAESVPSEEASGDSEEPLDADPAFEERLRQFGSERQKEEPAQSPQEPPDSDSQSIAASILRRVRGR